MSLEQRNRTTLIFIVGLLIAMLGLAFASVPLYRLFCQQTGFGGTPKIATEFNVKPINRFIKVYFNADVAPHLPWRFKPLQRSISVRAGEGALAFYQAENTSSKPVIGMATYNVTPDKAGPYFNKIECFCFIEQVLKPGQVMDMPVQFFIDPEIDKDPNLKDVTSITLSYTFFPYTPGMQLF